MNLAVNGETQQIPNNLTMRQVLIYLKLEPRMVAVEYNGEILHRQHWDETVLAEGDRLEIVTMVGGG
ncbi:sulfur carrier protein ThiS [Synechococcus sp. PCC 7336]|uniref:sulfur carrier protein ThiS n=1 Tax=Synechococcus sp. PCC 7336 TaxID=195250 RepID=UPI00034500DE|nr:sulfur carrier protein ThiS [Synechococcus sp. PCC 7336]